MLNWDWTISDKSTLSTVAYMSNGRGGGARNLGKVGGKGMVTSTMQKVTIMINFAANAAVTPT
jgi:hypothetical protein